MKRDTLWPSTRRSAKRSKLAADERSWLSAIINSSTDAIISKDLSGDISSWNAAAERMFGYTPQEVIGKSIRMLIPEDRQAEEDAILAKINAGSSVSNFETIRLHKDGREVRILVSVSPIHDEAGAIVGASKIARDITQEFENRQRLQESESRFQTMADNISQLAWMADSEGLIFWFNKRWFDYTGTTLEEMKGWGWRAVHHPDHIDRVVKRIQHSWDTGEPWEDTFPLRGKDGKYRWFLSRAQAVRDEDGNIVRWFGTNTDISEQKRHEEQIELLMREVNHRSKNMLALVQSIARQTVANSEDFLPRFTQRIQALAANQDLLINSGWRGARVRDTIQVQLSHFGDLIGTRIKMNGPDVVLTASATQALSLTFHELATNAGKYGALTNESGCVDIRWRVVAGDGGTKQFDISWTESDGPEVSEPIRKGFGSIVMEKIARIAFGQSVNLEYHPAGLRWHLRSIDDRVFEPDFSIEPPESTPPEAEPAREPAAAIQPPGEKRRVLVVEDEAIIAIDVAAALEDAGYDVIGPVGSVFDAMQLLESGGCDIAVIDVNLGDEKADPIAGRLVSEQIPFVTVSGNSQDSAGDLYRHGLFLSKPIITQKLVGLVTSRVPPVSVPLN